MGGRGGEGEEGGGEEGGGEGRKGEEREGCVCTHCSPELLLKISDLVNWSGNSNPMEGH